LPLIGLGQIVGGFDYTIINEEVETKSCLSPSQILTTNNTACGLTYDGQSLWFLTGIDYWGNGINSINKIDLSGNLINSFNYISDSTNTTGDLCFDGVNLWRTDEQRAELHCFDNTGVILNTFLLPSNGCNDPNGFGIAWDGNYIWHSEYAYPYCNNTLLGDSTIFYKIDPFNGQVIQTFTLPYWILGIEFVNNNLHGVKFDPGTQISTKYIIDINTESYIDSVDWCIEHPLGLTFTGIDFWNVSGIASASSGLYKFTSTSTTNIKEIVKDKKTLLKVIDLLGRETKAINQVLIYIYDDGTIEKKIVFE
jgi:hypothetical protein